MLQVFLERKKEIGGATGGLVPGQSFGYRHREAEKCLLPRLPPAWALPVGQRARRWGDGCLILSPVHVHASMKKGFSSLLLYGKPPQGALVSKKWPIRF